MPAPIAGTENPWAMMFLNRECSSRSRNSLCVRIPDEISSLSFDRGEVPHSALLPSDRSLWRMADSSAAHAVRTAGAPKPA